jgi:hypothetical protein
MKFGLGYNDNVININEVEASVTVRDASTSLMFNSTKLVERLMFA